MDPARGGQAGPSAPGPPLPVLVWKLGVTPAGTPHPQPLRRALHADRLLGPPVRLSRAFCRPWAPWPRSLQAHPGEAERAAGARLRRDSLGGRQLPACGPGGAGRGGVRLPEAWPVLKSGGWTSGLLSGPLSGGPRTHPQAWKRGRASPLQPPSPSCRARGTVEATLACSNCPHGPCGPWAGAEEAAGPSPWARAAKV